MSRLRSRQLLAGMAAVATLCACGWATAPVSSADPVAPAPPPPGLQAPGLPAIQQISPAIQQAAANPQEAVSLLMAAASAFAGNSSPPSDSQRVADSVTQFLQDPNLPSAQVDMPATVPGVPVPMPNNVSVPGDLSQLLPPGVNLPMPGTPDADPSAAHVPAPNAGNNAHLPQGINPAYVVGPADPSAAHVPAPNAGNNAHLPQGINPAYVVGPAPAAAPAPAPGAAPDPAPPPSAVPPPGPAAPPVATPAAFGPDAPPTQDFMYPSIGQGCLKDSGNSIATALSVAGPAAIPKPGPKQGQTAYVFTAVGTPGPAPEQKLPLNVTWVNLTTGKSGTTKLLPNPQINPDGPTTLVAIADTGSGSVMSTIFGQVSTKDKQCNFLPTIGSTVVP